MGEYSLLKPVKIDLLFEECSMGWIFFFVLAKGERFKVSASHIWSPFHDMLKWLESLAVGCHNCSFELDEEGSGVTFSVERTSRGLDRFILRRDIELGDNQVLIDEIVERSQLVSAFYNSLRAFSKSSGYVSKKDEWESKNGLEAIHEITEYNFAKEKIFDYLMTLRLDSLEDLHIALDVYNSKHHVRAPHGRNLTDIFQDVVGPDATATPGSLDGTSLKGDRGKTKANMIENVLMEHYNSWCGEKLQDLQSDIIKRKYGVLVTDE